VTRDDRDRSEEVGAAIRGAADAVQAPPRLHAAVAARRRTAARRRWSAVAALATLAVIVALVAVLAKDEQRTTPPRAPSLAEVAGLALAPSREPPPPVDPRDPRFVRAAVGSLRFPSYGYGTGWVAVGRRTDAVGDRRAVTVAYANRSARVGYTIVEPGPPPRAPAAARRVWWHGVHATVLRHGGAVVVSWRVGGQTCVLASRDATEREMLRLASWT
jgi:hypothetical protein